MDKGYSQLLDTYKRMFGMIDAFHFNSQNTADVYGHFMIIPRSSRVIPITHAGIKDLRKKSYLFNGILKLGFVGSEAPFKGLPLLKRVLNRLNGEGFKERIELDVYGGREGEDNEISNLFYKGRFSSQKAEQVYGSIDMLIVPSIWYETFSLVALEALSFGTPVMVSNKVGAKDLISIYDSSYVFCSEDQLYEKIKSILLNPSVLESYYAKLMEIPWNFSIEQHSKDIIELYKSL